MELISSFFFERNKIQSLNGRENQIKKAARKYLIRIWLSDIFNQAKWNGRNFHIYTRNDEACL